MIRPLRRRHLWLVGAVAAAVAPLYLAALAARPAPAVQESLPAGLPPAESAPGGDVEAAAALPGAPTGAVAAQLPTTPPLRLRPVAGGAIEAAADGPIEGADLLLYWVADGSPEMADAHLLGALRGGERQRFELPAAAAGRPGAVVLYSLGHGEEVARAPWPATSRPAAAEGGR